MTQKDYVINPILHSRHMIDPELKPEFTFIPHTSEGNTSL